MSNQRRSYSTAQHIALTTQVGARCPLCDRKLFYTKNGRNHKAYELAHIYPLNPTDSEAAELAGAPKLHDDVNHPDNLIPLCRTCHGRFDKPRTRSEYLELYRLKRGFLKAVEQRDLEAEYVMDDRIADIIAALTTAAIGEDVTDLSYEPKTMEKKFDATMTVPLRRKLKHAVQDYFLTIRDHFYRLEHESPYSSTLIGAQFRTFYLEQKARGLKQPQIVENVVSWVIRKTGSDSREAAEAVVAYFVQDCEVLE